MIIKNVCLFLEALSIVICLHHLYGEKFRLDIATISFFAVDMIMMQAIDYFGLPRVVSILIYPIIALYCSAKFRANLKHIIINVILCFTFVGGLQLVALLLYSRFLDISLFVDMKLLLANGITALIVIFLFPMFKISKLACIEKDKSLILATTISVCFFMILFLMISYKKFKFVELEPKILLFVCCMLMFLLSGQLIKYKVKAKEIEIELRMQKLSAESIQGLIDNIRLRQHEFDNHINTIYSQLYTYHTYEELVNAQKSYCKLVTEENQFNKILSSGNSIVIGFLYVRFVEIDKEDVNISYQINIKDLDIGIPSYKVVEILGDLINNAVEALDIARDRSKLHVSVIETDRFYIEVRNESPYIDYRELGMFFSKDYSKKGHNRGLGLYNVKLICERYNMKISCKNVEIDGSNWLSFEVWKEI